MREGTFCRPRIAELFYRTVERTVRRGSGLRVTPIGIRAWATAVATGLFVVSWPASASGAPFELVWSAPETCPSREQIVQATQGRLVEDDAEPAEASPKLLVRGTVAADGAGFVVRLAMTDDVGEPLGEREVRVERESCRDVEGPTSLVIAMMITGARAPRASPDEPEAAPERPAPEGKPRPAEPRSADRPSPARTSSAAPDLGASSPQRVLAGASTVVSAGLLPSAGLGVGLRAAYSPGLRILVGLDAIFEGSAAVRVAGGSIGFQLVSAAARVGFVALHTERFDVIPTIAARGALLRVLPTGFSAVRDEHRWMTPAGAGALLRMRLVGRLFMEALPEVEVVFVRDAFGVREGDKLYHVHRPSPVAGRVSLGLGWAFR